MLAQRKRLWSAPDDLVNRVQESLKELTREKAPLEWSQAQGTLGNVLCCIGKLERGTMDPISTIVAALVAGAAEAAKPRGNPNIRVITYQI